MDKIPLPETYRIELDQDERDSEEWFTALSQISHKTSGRVVPNPAKSDMDEEIEIGRRTYRCCPEAYLVTTGKSDIESELESRDDVESVSRVSGEEPLGLEGKPPLSERKFEGQRVQ